MFKHNLHDIRIVENNYFLNFNVDVNFTINWRELLYSIIKTYSDKTFYIQPNYFNIEMLLGSLFNHKRGFIENKS